MDEITTTTEIEEIPYEVYAKLDNKLGITAVYSTAHFTVRELELQGYKTKIAEGFEGDIYGHAQNGFFPGVYGKPTLDDKGRPNFKFIYDTILELDIEEKEREYPEEVPVHVPTEQEKLNAQIMIKLAELTTKVGVNNNEL